MKFEQYAAEATRFIREVADELENGYDENQALRVTRTVFHTLREMLTPEESTHLIAQLPMYMKALYVDGWKIRKEKKIRSTADFFACLRKNSDRPQIDFGNDEEAMQRVQNVLTVLTRHVSTGEIMDIMDQFPSELAGIWRTPVQEHVRETGR